MSTVALLEMTKPKLQFSIDALMGTENKPFHQEVFSSVKDYSLPKSKSESSYNGSPQPVVVPIPTFPTPSVSRDTLQPGILGSGLYSRNLRFCPPGLEPSLAGIFVQAESYQAFPWYLQNRPRFLHHRYGPGPELPGFLLPPFRKAKRIRTAFSAAQLMKLEGAFDRNHYVTGAERKHLAESLGLTETQVKVWFQNRRTKAKRQVLEDRERNGKNQSLLPSKEIESQNHSSPSDPNLSPIERRTSSMCGDDIEDMSPTEDQNKMTGP